ncbi:methyltransferase [Colwellia sp. MEBiC06753]
MLSPFTINDTPLELDRFPQSQVNRSLQAWDATDEYLIDYCQSQQLLTTPKRILVFNDNFGALACQLNEHQVYCVSDSYLSHQGTLHNLEKNELTHEHTVLLDSLAELPSDIDLVLYRIPKSNALLSFQLAKIAEHYNSNAVFIAGAKAKDIHSSTLKLFEKYLGETTTSLAKKKSRLVFSALESSTSGKAIDKALNPITWQLEGSSYTIANHAGVFSPESLDIGARFFLEHLPKLKPEQTVVDLGCGNGVIGLMALTEQPQAKLIFRDESYMAVASAKANIEQNLPDSISQCDFATDDCLTELDSDVADIILCNPPFHQQHATTDHIAWQMFNDAKRVLKFNGELRIIGNRQLGYHIKLKRIFGNCKTIASNKKFVVLSSTKR